MSDTMEAAPEQAAEGQDKQAVEQEGMEVQAEPPCTTEEPTTDAADEEAGEKQADGAAGVSWMGAVDCFLLLLEAFGESRSQRDCSWAPMRQPLLAF